VPRQAELSSANKKHLDVAAGILRDADGCVLVAERIGGGPFNGMWEFPGGKIGPGETALQALQRELAEEIGVTGAQADAFMKLRHEYPDRIVSIEFFLVEQWQQEPRGLEGQQLKWSAIADLDSLPLLPADQPVIEALRNLSSYNSASHQESHAK
jgi:8-oxo-dGTP diphosphatase